MVVNFGSAAIHVEKVTKCLELKNCEHHIPKLRYTIILMIPTAYDKLLVHLIIFLEILIFL